MSESELKKSKSKSSVGAIKSVASGIGGMGAKSAVGFDKSSSRLRVRKPSFGFSGVPGIRPVERTSQLGIEFKRPPLMFLNTYQLDPKPQVSIAKTLAVVEELLDENFNGHRYNATVSTGLAIRLANELMRKLKTMNLNRYRIIAIVTIGQKRAQSYSNALSFLWDHDRDIYVNTQREEETAFIQVTVLAIYLD